MTVSGKYIRSLGGDRECLEALAFLADSATAYPSGKFTPPLRAKSGSEDPARVIGVAIRCSRKDRRGGGVRVTRYDVHDGADTSSFGGMDEPLASWFSDHVLRPKYAGSLLITGDSGRGILDIWLASQGPSLLALGYQLLPCGGSGSISFVKIRKGKRTWTLTTFETAVGSPVAIGLQLAGGAMEGRSIHQHRALALWTATDAAQDFIRSEFGSALRPTVGMTAMACARRSLPPGLQKWRPTPLLVAMERAGRGYRGGMTFASKYRGPAWRIDVNRQYTHALRTPLPLRVAFGRYKDERTTPHGVFMCRLQLSNTLPYPLGVWDGERRRFGYQTVGRGTYVCVLHTSEFQGLIAAGATIEATYGYVFTATFDLSAYVDRIQAVLRTYGRRSPEAIITKALGNYVYGKFAQRPDRVELLYSLENPGKEWWPYWDENGVPHEDVWERKVIRHTASQHVDIAASITGAARSQTAATWAFLSACGLEVVRSHTDSLTTSDDPSAWLECNDDEIGMWKLESVDSDMVIVGPNAYIDGDDVHIGGVTDPTYSMIERMYDGEVVHVVQAMKTPRRGLQRGEINVRREYRAKAT